MKLLAIGKPGKIPKYIKNPAEYSMYEIVYVPNGSSDEEILRAGSDAELVLVDAMTRLSGKVIESMPNLKLIHSEGVGYQAIDLAAADARQIPVCNCKGMNASAVAEHTIMLMLGILKDIAGGQKAVYEGRQITVKENYMACGSLKELADCRIGLVGFGDIAKETARLAHAFGAEVVYYSRHQAAPEVEEAYHVSYLPLERLLAECDMVSLHVPVTPETREMADAAFFAKMKDGSYYINTSRGELQKSEDILAAIRSGKLAGAAMDTLENEPVRADHPILQAEPEVAAKILLSPHIAGITASSFRRGYEIVFGNFKRVREGLTPVNIVNLKSNK